MWLSAAVSYTIANAFSNASCSWFDKGSRGASEAGLGFELFWFALYWMWNACMTNETCHVKKCGIRGGSNEWEWNASSTCEMWRSNAVSAKCAKDVWPSTTIWLWRWKRRIWKRRADTTLCECSVCETSECRKLWREKDGKGSKTKKGNHAAKANAPIDDLVWIQKNMPVVDNHDAVEQHHGRFEIIEIQHPISRLHQEWQTLNNTEG